MTYTQEEILKIIEKTPALLKVLDIEINESIQEKVIKNNLSHVKFIKNPSLKIQTQVVKNNAILIKHISNPCEEIQLLAVKKHSWVICKIDNPTILVQKVAINDNFKNINHIKNPPLEIKLYAIERNMQAISLIEEVELLSEAIREQLIEKNPFLIKAFKSPSMELIVKAILLNPKDNGIFINKLDKINLLEVLTKLPHLFKQVSTLKNDETIQKHVISIEPKQIQYIENPSDAILKLALETDISCLEYIEKELSNEIKEFIIKLTNEKILKE